jgi:predicted tellurium resistance membrane protein TerC
MSLLLDAQAWVAFGVLAALEIILGLDNVVVLALLVARLPEGLQRSARLLGLALALLMRLILLFSVTWLTTLTQPVTTVAGLAVSWRSVVLFGGGLLLCVGSLVEIRESAGGRHVKRVPRAAPGFWLVVVQIGLLDLLFSVDTVFTAVGLSSRVEVMVAAIVFAILAMLLLAGWVGELLRRRPGLQTIGLWLLVLVGASLVAESVGWEVPKSWLYVAMALVSGIGWLLIR